jgi:anthranilate synthase/aminodeoxychorismate synthase-like glutamine amidotransferase
MAQSGRVACCATLGLGAGTRPALSLSKGLGDARAGCGYTRIDVIAELLAARRPKGASVPNPEPLVPNPESVLLLIDNYDSFVFNLARYFERLGQATVVVRNDATDVTAIRAMRPEAIILSPGPCTPTEAGWSLEIVRELHEKIPILGVCLGHQTIAAALGGRVVQASEPMHGRASAVFHDGSGVFSGLPNPLSAGRYHSLVVEESTLPECLQVTARTADGIVMAVAHRHAPVVGLQFHPESILTEHGYVLLANFLRIAGISVPSPNPLMDDVRASPTGHAIALPDVPITF